MKLFKTQNKIGLFLICFLIFILSLFSLLNRDKRLKRENFCTYDDVVCLSRGDEWGYQSLAVNLIMGHGYQSGGIEKFDTYKFGRIDDGLYYPGPGGEPITFYTYFIQKGEFNSFRTPGYPLFLALNYKIFGIHPRIIKIIQVILLALCASLMPVIGMHYWSADGIFCGLISSFVFIRYFAPNPKFIMAEPLLIFGLFVWTIFLIFWENSPSVLRTLIMGVISAIIVLIKSLSIFIPPLFLFYILFKFGKRTQTIKLCAIFTLAFFLCILPWSIYLTAKAGRLIFLSKQPRVLLLDSNNEDSLNDGGWCSAWRKENKNDQGYLYVRLRDSKYSPIEKVLIFLSQNKRSIPKLLKNKLLKSLGPKRAEISLILLGMFLYYLISFLPGRLVGSKFIFPEKIPVFPLLFFLNILFITLIFCGYHRFLRPFIPFFILPSIYFSWKIIKLPITKYLSFNRRK